MDETKPLSIDDDRLRRRLKELNLEVKSLFSTMAAGPELVSRWESLIREIRRVEEQVLGFGNQRAVALRSTCQSKSIAKKTRLPRLF